MITIRLDRQALQYADRDWLGPITPGAHPADFCYLCGTTGGDSTTEHVVARAFFGGTATAHPTLRAHKRCNGRYAEAEEYLRDTLAQMDAAEGEAVESARVKTSGSLKPEYPTARSRRKWEQQRKETNLQNGRYVWLATNVNRDLWDLAFWKLTRGLGFWITGMLCPTPENGPWGTGAMKVYRPLTSPAFSMTIDDGLRSLRSSGMRPFASVKGRSRLAGRGR